MALPPDVPQDPLACLPRPEGDPVAAQDNRHAFEPMEHKLQTISNSLDRATGEVVGSQWLGLAGAHCEGAVDGFGAAYTKSGGNAHAGAAAIGACANRWEAALGLYDQARRLADQALAEEARYREHAQNQAADLEAGGEADQATQVRAQAQGWTCEPERSNARRMAQEAIQDFEKATGEAVEELQATQQSIGTFTRAFGYQGSPMLELLPSIAGFSALELKKVQAAQQVAGLMADGEVSEAEADRLEGLLRGNAEDPAFASTLLHAVGSKALLSSVPDVAGNEAVMQPLGLALGAGTDPSAETHVGQGWLRDLKAACDRGPQGDGGPGSYQALAAVMGAGLAAKAAQEARSKGQTETEPLYSEWFLTGGEANPEGVADAMYNYERSHGGAEVWTETDPRDRIPGGFHGYQPTSITTEDRGMLHGGDAMVPVMEALAGNPAAAQEFFAPEATVEDFSKSDGAGLERVDYFLTDREWYVEGPTLASERTHIDGAVYPDEPTVAEKLATPGTDALGEALESATLEGPDDQAAARIMGETVHQLGQPHPNDTTTGLNGVTPASMRDSVGHMLSGHIEEANQELINGTNLEPGDPRYAPSSGALFGKEGGYDPVFDPGELERVIRGAAYDPDAYVEMYNAQKVYAAARMDQALSGPGTVQEAAVDSSHMFGALDQARADAVEQHHVRSDAAYNEAIEQRGRITNAAISNTVGQVPYVGGVADQGASAVIDQMVEEAKRDTSGVADAEIAELYGNGREQAKQLAESAMWNHQMWKQGHPPPDVLLHDDGTPIEFSRIPQDPPPMEPPAPSELGPGQEYQSLQEWRAAKERYAAYHDFKATEGYTPIENVQQDIDQAYSEGKTQSREAAGG